MALAGKVALVTNAAREGGTSWHIAKALAAAGMQLVLHDEEDAKGLQVHAEDLYRAGYSCLAIIAELTEAEQRKKMLEKVLEQFGRLDVVVIRAFEQPRISFPDLDAEELQRCLHMIQGSIDLCRLAAKQMIVQGEGGSILITESLQTGQGGFYQANRVFANRLELELSPFEIQVSYLDKALPEASLQPPRFKMAKPTQLTQMAHAAVFLASRGLVGSGLSLSQGSQERPKL
jgi:NAD(P)-dependent dehydrogenase (short-subunit alcohol dehydrogenase family)